jgi:hypothetical protein
LSTALKSKKIKRERERKREKEIERERERERETFWQLSRLEQERSVFLLHPILCHAFDAQVAREREREKERD